MTLQVEETDEIQAEELEVPEGQAEAEEVVEETADEAEEETTEAEPKAEEDEGVHVGFDDEQPEDRSADTPQFRQMRTQNRQLVRRVRELEAQVKTPAQAAAEEDPGPEPTLDGCNFEPEEFKAKLTEWLTKKSAIDQRKQVRAEAERKAQEDYQKKVDAFRAASKSLKVDDFEDAEASAQTVFTPVQLGIMVAHMERPAELIYALGKSEAKAKELAAIADPIRFALAARQLEEKHLKVTGKKTVPTPERVVRGAAASTMQSNATLDALKAKAAKTGDYSAYFEAKRKAQK